MYVCTWCDVRECGGERAHDSRDVVGEAAGRGRQQLAQQRQRAAARARAASADHTQRAAHHAAHLHNQ